MGEIRNGEARLKAKYPPKFQVGETVSIAMGQFRGAVVTVCAIEPGWPYANYVIFHTKEGKLHMNERELGLYKAGWVAEEISRQTKTTGGEDVGEKN